MPIEVRHGPPMSMVGTAMFATGRGQRAQERQRELEQLAQQQARLRLAEQEMRNNQALAWARLQQGAQESALDRQLRLMSLQQSAQDTALGRQLQFMGLQQSGQESEANRRLRMMEMLQNQQRYNLLWETEGVESLEEQAARVQKEVSQSPLKPEGKALWADLSGKLRAIQKQRTSLRPKQYGNLLGQWLEEANRSNLDAYVDQPPTPDQILSQRVHQLPDGSWGIIQPDGKIELRPGASGAAEGVSSYFSDPKNLQQMYEDATQRIQQQMAMEYSEKHPEETKGPEAFTPDADQIVKEIARQKQVMEKLEQALHGEGAPAAAPPKEKIALAAKLSQLEFSVKDISEDGRVAVEMNDGKTQWFDPQKLEAVAPVRADLYRVTGLISQLQQRPRLNEREKTLLKDAQEYQSQVQSQLDELVEQAAKPDKPKAAPGDKFALPSGQRGGLRPDAEPKASVSDSHYIQQVMGQMQQARPPMSSDNVSVNPQPAASPSDRGLPQTPAPPPTSGGKQSPQEKTYQMGRTTGGALDSALRAMFGSPEATSDGGQRTDEQRTPAAPPIQREPSQDRDDSRWNPSGRPVPKETDDPVSQIQWLQDNITSIMQRHGSLNSVPPEDLYLLEIYNQAAQELQSKIKPTTKAEYDALPSGAAYVAPDGTKRRKP